MDVKLSIGEEDVGTNISIKVEVQKDEGGASLNNALATVQTAEQQVPAKVRAAARKLAGVIKGANVEDISSTIETLADQDDASGIFNFRGQSWGSLLHIAAATGKSNILRPLLPHVDAHLIAAKDDWGNTPLHIATKFKALGVVVMLIRRARDLPENILRMENNHKNTALHEAVLTGDADLVSYLSGEDLEPVYWENMDRKSPLYLALDIGNPKIFQVLISLSLDPSRIQGLTPVHGAFAREQYDLVDKILEGNMKLFAMTDSGEGNVFHLAAFLKKPQVLKFLRPETEYLAQARDANGDLPIHIASKSGHVALIEKLHPISHSVNGHRQTVLHLAAKYGRASTVKYILSHPDLGKMINERDHDGNTPAHLATKYLQPAALTHLVLDERIKPSLLNCDHLAAYDIAQNHSRRGLRQGLVRMLLLSVSAKRPDQFILKPEAREEEYTSGRMLNQEKLDDALDKWLLVATLVTTVTFAAGFAVPGGFNGSDMAPKDERGMATMLDNRKFQAFVICNTIAMFCSMGSVLGFLAAFMTEIHLSLFGFQLAGMLLAISLLAMSAAFLIGVALTVSKLSWLATVILGIGSAFVFIITGASLSPVVIPLSIRFTFLLDCLRPIRPLVSRFLLACIILLDVETTLDDSKEGKAESKTSASRPLDGGRKD